ncbi:MAG: HYR domain-containing protein, partial [Bacteroidota bacterium]|nr:HYR domain-containing protein [Bacteroidota bacterium]
MTSFPSTHDSGDFFNVGSTTVSYSAMDAAGNGVTSSFTVTVTDGQAPTIDGLPADISVSNDPGQCAAAVTWTEPSATDNCAVTSFSSDETNGASYPVGTTTVTYTAEDAQGNQTTASFNITVTDGENPVFSGTPADITVNNDAGVCSAAVSWAAPTATDNCGATVTSTHNPGASFNVGTTTVTYTATDAANNSVTTSFTVTVVDNESPTIAGNPGDLSASNDAGNCSAAVSWTAPTASDNCSQTLTSTHSPGDTFAVGTTTVTYTSTDAANNTATISFNVVVTDTEAPVISAMSDMTVSTDPGTCDAVVTFTDPAATDNCAISTLTADIASGSTFSLGTTTVTYTATDIHGNSSTASFDVIVEDDEAPAIGTPAADESVECDGSGNTAALMAWLSNNAGAAATDNCSGVTWSNDFTTMANTCGGAGAVQVIFTATDAAGNTSSTSATFTIEDTTAPTITTPASDLTVECDGAGNTSDLNTWLANFAGATANDDCSSASFSHNYGTGAIMSDLCGATGSVTVTFTATD